MRTFPFLKNNKQRGTVLTVVAIFIAVLAISGSLFFTHTQTVNGANGNMPFICTTDRCSNDAQCGVGGHCVITPGGSGSGSGRLSLEDFFCPGHCTSTVFNPGGGDEGGGCQFGTCPDGSCKPSAGYVCPVGGNPFDFSLSNSGPLVVTYNAQANQVTIDSVNVTVQLQQAPPNSVTLSTANPPASGITSSFLDPICIPNVSCTRQLSITVPSQTPVGSYTIVVTGTGGGKTHTTNVTVNVNAPAPVPAECAPDTNGGNQPLCGFAWAATDEGSDTGAGWISFNAIDCDPDGDGMTNSSVNGCPSTPVATSQYKVTVSPGGNLRGCAWSPNVGWIKFGNLSANPSTPGNTSPDAKMVSGTNNPNGGVTTLQGWARACAGTVNGDCSDMTSRSDGWDGWISLKNAISSSATISFLNGVFSGSAWGSDVIGWMNWNPGNAAPVRYCTVQLFDFGLNGPSSITVQPGGAAGVVPIAVTKIGTAASQNVALTSAVISGPSGIGHVFAPTSGLPDYSSNLSITAASGVAPGAYVVRVTGTAGSVVHTKDITVNVGAPVANDLVLTCSPPAGGVGYVNKPVVFNVSAAGTSGPPVADFYFTTTGVDPDASSAHTSSNPLVGVTKTFTTIGRKTVVIKVKDSASTPATGTCTVDVLIKVKPDINER